MRSAMRAVLLLLGTSASAALPSRHAAAQSKSGFLEQETMTGNWGGTRTDLEDAGVKLRAHYTTESGANPTGGRFEAARYTQQIDFGADLDFSKILQVSEGQMKITFVDRRGRSLSADALGGNKFAVQEVFGGGQTFRLVELHYQQELLDKQLLLDIGWQPLGSNFATSPVYCKYFQTLATCGTLQLNNFNWQNWPFAQWGGRVLFSPRPEYCISLGTYQTNPRHATDGLDLTFSGTGVIVPLEVAWYPGQGAHGFPGEYKLGGYYDFSQAPDVFRDINGQPAGLTGAPFAVHNGRWGIYALATQMVYREESDNKRGLTLFGMAIASDPRTETFRYFYVGAFYQGPFSRDEDFVSFLYARGTFNGRLTRFQRDLDSVSPGATGIQTNESVLEVDYEVQIAPWLAVRPNVQYVIRPTGTGTIPDALVIGLFTCVTL